MFSLLHAIRNRNKGKMEQQASNLKPNVRSELTRDILEATSNADMNEIQDALQEARAMLERAEASEQFVGLRFQKYQSMLERRAAMLRGTDGDDKVCGSDEAVESDQVPVDFHEPSAEVEGTDSYAQGVAVVENGDAEHDDDEVDDDDVDPDEETGQASLTPEERERQLEKLRQDEEALEQVRYQLQSLQETVSALRKRVFALEQQRVELDQKTKECRDFLVAAAAADDKETTGIIDDDDDDDNELELSNMESGEECKQEITAADTEQR
jgi:hypothetical protein